MRKSRISFATSLISLYHPACDLLNSKNNVNNVEYAADELKSPSLNPISEITLNSCREAPVYVSKMTVQLGRRNSPPPVRSSTPPVRSSTPPVKSSPTPVKSSSPKLRSPVVQQCKNILNRYKKGAEWVQKELVRERDEFYMEISKKLQSADASTTDARSFCERKKHRALSCSPINSLLESAQQSTIPPDSSKWAENYVKHAMGNYDVFTKQLAVVNPRVFQEQRGELYDMLQENLQVVVNLTYSSVQHEVLEESLPDLISKITAVDPTLNKPLFDSIVDHWKLETIKKRDVRVASLKEFYYKELQKSMKFKFPRFDAIFEECLDAAGHINCDL